ncbi:GNAT family protein [Bacillus carboniphilus]|uniref:GNAT family protein n=1 Tax=Bacillus carboniphilus TaxID=86663 RepID=A0ABN0W8U7_9BACI
MIKPFLAGERVYLRPVQKSDYETIHTVTQDSEIRRLTGTQDFLTYAKIERAYEAFALEKNRFDLMIVLKENDQIIGDLALLDIDYLNRTSSVRIAIHQEEYMGNGYGTEALSLILNHAFMSLNIRRVGLNVYAFNARAISSYQKLGFRQEGIIRGEIFSNGEYHDNILMGVFAEEFFTAKQERGKNDDLH